MSTICSSHCALFAVLISLAAPAVAGDSKERTTPRKIDRMRDGSHDFDFELGSWRTHVKRLLHPLTGSTTWVEYEGTTDCRKIWNGQANLVELDVNGSAGRLQLLSLRLYNREAHQWTLSFSSAAGGTVSVPATGEFIDGRGEFYDQEPVNGRAVLLRFVITQVNATTWKFEQAFSEDGGKSWEVNWIAIDERVSEVRAR